LRANEVEALGEELSAGVVKDDDEVHLELHKCRSWKFGFDMAWIFALQIGVGLIPGGILAGRSVQDFKFVGKGARGASEVLAGEIFLDIRKTSHQNKPGDSEKATHEADHSEQDDGKSLPTQ